MKKLLIKYLGLDIQLEKIKIELNYLQKQISYLDNQIFNLMLKKSELHRDVTRLKNKDNEQPLVTHEAICRKRWEDWEEFNKKACYPEDCSSPYADGFTRGAKWVLEQIKSK